MSLLEKLMPLIPEDKQPDIKALIDGELQAVAKETETAVKKNISEVYGINLFEKDIHKAFNNGTFVKKEAYAEKEQEVNALNERLSQLTNEYENAQKELENYKTNAELTDVSIKLISKGFNAERLNAIKPLLKEHQGSIDEKVELVAKELPELFLGKKQVQTFNPNGESETLTERERYLKKLKEGR
jgi:flagellar biosynthesis/type III secretory pathway protein FliH